MADSDTATAAVSALRLLGREAGAMAPETVAEVLGCLATTQALLLAALTRPAHVGPAGPSPPAKEQDAVLKLKEAADLLGRSTTWVKRHRDRLPRVLLSGKDGKPNGRYGFSRVRLQRWIADRTQEES